MFKQYMNILDIRLEAIFIQKNDQKKNRIICYKVKTLIPIKKNYSIIKKKCLVVIWTM